MGGVLDSFPASRGARHLSRPGWCEDLNRAPNRGAVAGSVADRPGIRAKAVPMSPTALAPLKFAQFRLSSPHEWPTMWPPFQPLPPLLAATPEDRLRATIGGCHGVPTPGTTARPHRPAPRPLPGNPGLARADPPPRRLRHPGQPPRPHPAAAGGNGHRARGSRRG